MRVEVKRVGVCGGVRVDACVNRDARVSVGTMNMRVEVKSGGTPDHSLAYVVLTCRDATSGKLSMARMTRLRAPERTTVACRLKLAARFRITVTARSCRGA
jgi:hypothetical protein